MIQAARLEMSGLGRQFLLLAFACLGGAVLGLTVPSTIAWAKGAPIVCALALLAGTSSLWSP